MKRMLALILGILMIFPCMAMAAQPEEIAPYSSNYFHCYGTTLGNQGNGVILITFSTTGTGICDTIGVANFWVEKLGDDGYWDNVTGVVPGQTASGVVTYTFSKYFQGVPGETYRVQVTFISVRNGGAETKSYTSARITARN